MRGRVSEISVKIGHTKLHVPLHTRDCLLSAMYVAVWVSIA